MNTPASRAIKAARESAKACLFKALEAKALLKSMSAAEWKSAYPDFHYRVHEELKTTRDFDEAMHRALTVLIAEILTICL